jgi:hypothetical protein
MRLFGKSPPTKKNVYEGLRLQILEGSREKFGISPVAVPNQGWGLVTDWSMDRGVATVVALSDGTASIYLSSGGGFIGGGQSHELIRKGARNAVTIAAKFQPTMRAASTYPLPAQDHVTFFVLTDAGVFSESASVKGLSSHHGALSALGDAMQEIITQYRKIQQ